MRMKRGVPLVWCTETAPARAVCSRPYVIALCLFFLVFFFILRGLLRMVIEVYLSNKAIRKRGRNQNIIEWLTYKNFRDALPKKFIILYIFHFISFLVAIGFTILFDLLQFNKSWLRAPGDIYIIFFSVLFLVLDIIWYDKKRRQYNPGKTLKKKNSSKNWLWKCSLEIWDTMRSILFRWWACTCSKKSFFFYSMK